jgi:hypothetical protein
MGMRPMPIKTGKRLGPLVLPSIIKGLGCQTTTHIPSVKSLEAKVKLPITKIKSTFEETNTIVIHYAHSILVIMKTRKPTTNPKRIIRDINLC